MMNVHLISAMINAELTRLLINKYMVNPVDICFFRTTLVTLIASVICYTSDKQLCGYDNQNWIYGKGI